MIHNNNLRPQYLQLNPLLLYCYLKRLKSWCTHVFTLTNAPNERLIVLLLHITWYSDVIAGPDPWLENQ